MKTVCALLERQFEAQNTTTTWNASTKRQHDWRWSVGGGNFHHRREDFRGWAALQPPKSRIFASCTWRPLLQRSSVLDIFLPASVSYAATRWLQIPLQITQQWQPENRCFSEFCDKEVWPLNSLDLNPMTILCVV